MHKIHVYNNLSVHCVEAFTLSLKPLLKIPVKTEQKLRYLFPCHLGIGDTLATLVLT